MNRSTFYLHYNTIDDLFEEALESAFKKLVAKYPSTIRPVDQCEQKDLHLYTPEYLMPYLAFARENRNLLILAATHKKLFHTDDTLSLLYNRLFNPILARFDVPEEDRRYVIAFFMSGIHAVIISWLEGGCQESDEQICELIYKYVKR